MTRAEQMLLIGFVPLFRDLGKGEIQELLRAGEEADYPEGAEIIREGTPGSNFHLLLQGQARISVGGRTVGRAHPGDHFGEMALIDGGVRSATVTATTPVATLRIGSKEFLALLDAHPRMSRKIMVEMARRLRAAHGSAGH